MLDQDKGVIPVPQDRLPEYGQMVRIQGRRAFLAADRDGQSFPFLRHNEQMVVRFTEHIQQLLEQGWADLIDYIEYPSASEYFPTMDDVYRMIGELATTLPGEAILGMKVVGTELVVTVGREDGSTSRDIPVALPQLVDMQEQIGKAEDAAGRSEAALEQIMQLVQDAAQYAADKVTSDAKEYAAVASAAAERSVTSAEAAQEWVESIGTIQGPMGPRGPQGPPGGGASDMWQAEPAEVIDLLPNLTDGWTAESFTVQRVGGWILVQVTSLVPKTSTWGYPVSTKGSIPDRLRPPWQVFGMVFSSGANDGGRLAMTTGGRVYLDSLVAGQTYSGSLAYPLASGAPVPLVEGPQGEKGDPGPQGIQGKVGPQGEPGKDGASVAYEGMVATYADLPADLTEDDQGKGWVVNADGRIYVWDGSKFPDDGSAPLFRGPTGAKGPKGDKGETGARGATGLTGPRGAQGDKGDTGDPGPTGERGPKGEKGDTGNPGAQGATGLPGRDGRGLVVRGTVASPASLPSSATVGDGYVISSTGKAVQWDGTAWSEQFAWTGPTGSQGERGLRGEQGPVGPKGDRGPTGSMNSDQLIGVFGSSRETRKPYGELGWTGPAYAPPADTWTRLRTNTDGRLSVGYDNGCAFTNNNTPRLVAPVDGFYILIARQTWDSDTGARGCGLGTSQTAGDAGVWVWNDIGLGRLCTAVSVVYCGAGTTLYPWTFTARSSGKMTPNARGMGARYGMYFLGAM